MATDFYINDYNVDSLGLLVGDLSGWSSSHEVQDPVVQVPGRAGSFLASRQPIVSPRRVSVAGELKAATLALLLANQEELARRALNGVVELTFGDDLTKKAIARCRSFNTGGVFPHFVSLSRIIVMDFECFDPYRYSIAPSIVTHTSGAASSVPLGTAPSAPVLRIYGAATNPTITLYDGAMNVLQTMAFTLTLAAADYLEIDCLRQTAIRYNSGVSQGSQLGLLSLVSPSGDFLRLDPAYAVGGELFLATSAGTLEAVYSRAWW